MKLFWNEEGISKIGEMIEKIILEIPIYYKGILIDKYVVMPDHVHLIVEINKGNMPIMAGEWESNLNNNGRIWESARTDSNVGADPRICPMDKINNLSLSEIIQRFKILSTNRYIDGVKNNNWPRFYKRLW